MRRNRFRPGDDAVSTVVGVVLLVGIAVMMTTAIGVFVLGFGPGDSPPESEIQFYQDAGSSDVVITVVRPAGLVEEEVVVRVNGQPACYDGLDWTGSGSIDKSETVRIDGYGASCSNSIGSGDLVRVIWRSPSGDQTDIVGEYEVP
jgi:FlaG/FlaF family flagellin (archaellin)